MNKILIVFSLILMMISFKVNAEVGAVGKDRCSRKNLKACIPDMLHFDEIRDFEQKQGASICAPALVSVIQKFANGCELYDFVLQKDLIESLTVLVVRGTGAMRLYAAKAINCYLKIDPRNVKSKISDADFRKIEQLNYDCCTQTQKIDSADEYLKSLGIQLNKIVRSMKK